MKLSEKCNLNWQNMPKTTAGMSEYNDITQFDSNYSDSVMWQAATSNIHTVSWKTQLDFEKCK